MGYHSIDKNGIRSELGKRVDRIYVMTKKLEAINKRNNKYEEAVLNKCNSCIRKIEDINYRSILRRGMLKDEISIERLDPVNLRVTSQIEVGKIKRITFNTIEEDFINYMMKKKVETDKKEIEYYICEYASKANLTNSSIDYMNIILDIPQESLKYLYKFRTEENMNYDEFYKIAEKELEF
ncbi:MAG: hypothetical protein ACRCVJ_04345 [Clostridium sp.]|uniref:hypothetical protein n=1 Tax=Clostridium sp. TaxID=1506 RepID=UPI003F2D7A6D